MQNDMTDTSGNGTPVAERAATSRRRDDVRGVASSDRLAPIMGARSVAVIGASKSELHELKLTGRPIKFLRKHGYAGRIVAVNPKYQELDGVPCYPSISAVPDEVDVAAIFLPKE